MEGLAGADGSECTGGMRCSDAAGGFDGVDGVNGGSDGVDGVDGGGSDGFVAVDGGSDGVDGVDEGGSDGSDSLDRLGHTLKWEKMRKLRCRNILGWEATIGDIVR